MRKSESREGYAIVEFVRPNPKGKVRLLEFTLYSDHGGRRYSSDPLTPRPARIPHPPARFRAALCADNDRAISTRLDDDRGLDKGDSGRCATGVPL